MPYRSRKSLWFARGAPVVGVLALYLSLIALLGSSSLRPGGAPSQSPTPSVADQKASPEAGSGVVARELVRAKHHMVVAANPLAAEAGRTILRAGGSAIDAAIATQLVLNLVEPQSSGIGGGAFLLAWDAATSRLTTYDARETAPMTATGDRFLPQDGSKPQWETTVHSGLSVGVPGLLRGLELAHRKHGRLAWAELFAPAIRIAEAGFAISPRLHGLLKRTGADRFDAAARSYFFDALGAPHPVGHVLRSPEMASTLRAIAAGGAGVFYSGDIAAAMLARLKTAPNAPSDMTLADLARYKAVERSAVCAPYRGYQVCGMGPPSSGGLTIAQVLGILGSRDIGAGPLEPDALHLIVEAEKLAYADRDRYMADADFVPAPGGLLDPAYLAARGALIKPDIAIAKAEPGEPPQKSGHLYGRDATIELPGTSHLSIVDRDGNAVSMTTTIESAFGSRMMVGGFLLNNELTDFSWLPLDEDGYQVANRVEPGKRPRSSMSPTMIFRPDGKLWALTGSPGGSRIILYTLKSIFGLIDWKLDAQATAGLVNFGSRNGPLEVEAGPETRSVRAKVAGKGHTVVEVEMTSGLHIIVRRDDGLEGGVDPRREGVALGD